LSNVIAKDQTEEKVPRLASLNLRDIEQEARAVVEQARQASRQMLSDAAAKAREVERLAAARGERSGYEAGLKRGTAEGRQAAMQAETERLRQETSSVRQALISALSEIEAQQHDLVAQARSDLLSLALALAERICRRRLSEDRTALEALLEEVIEITGRSHGLVLRVNPADAAAVERFLADRHMKVGPAAPEAGGAAESPVVCLECDETISRGGCIAERRGGRVDARLETQLGRLADELLGEGAAETLAPQTSAATALLDHVAVAGVGGAAGQGNGQEATAE
jgi:flagellar assembly protein FliH